MKKELKLELSEGIKRLKILTSQIVNTQFVGGYKSVFKGKGMEFEDYRQYTPDDDSSVIDWKASVRSKQLLIREFAEERNLNVFFLIDVSSSMVYGSIDKLKMEYAGELIAALSYVVISAGDSVGFALFSDKIVKNMLPAMGFVQYHNLINTLVNPDYYGGKYDLTEALRFTLSFLKEASIVIIISDFIGLKNDWERYIKVASKKFDLIGIMIKDPADKILPNYDGQVILEDPFSAKQVLVRPAALESVYKSYTANQERAIKNSFLNAGANFLELTTNESFVKPITNLFVSRAKKVRR
ncbi:DUF58 domain-containing protein [Candidatus Woesearchaeota archaeon]|nr:DUF58 domain-containing protein [Candidatus Woesearchaeota archaeon]